MASERLQINVRTTTDTRDRFMALVPRIARALGVELSQADVFRLAVLELERRYPPEPPGWGRRTEGPA